MSAREELERLRLAQEEKKARMRDKVQTANESEQERKKREEGAATRIMFQQYREVSRVQVTEDELRGKHQEEVQRLLKEKKRRRRTKETRKTRKEKERRG
eukprot:m.203528 g.203528  ORF g.203528 m.203528 type:complete len:100 (-) comp15765_c0_seq8:334-633(-)